MNDEIELVRRYFQAWNERNFHELEQLLTTDHIFRGVIAGRETYTASAFCEVLRTYFQVFPDLKLEIEHVFGGDGWAAARVVHRGTHLGQGWPLPPLRRRMEAPNHHHFRISDGRIAEAWEQWDRVAVREQLSG